MTIYGNSKEELEYYKYSNRLQNEYALLVLRHGHSCDERMVSGAIVRPRGEARPLYLQAYWEMARHLEDYPGYHSGVYDVIPLLPRGDAIYDIPIEIISPPAVPPCPGGGRHEWTALMDGYIWEQPGYFVESHEHCSRCGMLRERRTAIGGPISYCEPYGYCRYGEPYPRWVRLYEEWCSAIAEHRPARPVPW